jgi:hypothetical protein
MSTKPRVRVLGTVLAVFGALLGMLLWMRHRSLMTVPHARIHAMEANHPWMIVEPDRNQDVTVPYLDKHDPNILYLVVVQSKGEAIRVDLKTQITSSYKFDVNKWEEVGNLVIHCLRGHHYDFSGYYCFNNTQRSSLWAEFRGQGETKTVRHQYGYPWANEPGLRKAEFRTGGWYIMDERNGRKIELLRVKIQMAELNFFDLGDLYITPDERWAIFRLSNINGRVFIFDRKASGMEKFND